MSLCEFGAKSHVTLLHEEEEGQQSKTRRGSRGTHRIVEVSVMPSDDRLPPAHHHEMLIVSRGSTIVRDDERGDLFAHIEPFLPASASRCTTS
jgi:hypothetical protein